MSVLIRLNCPNTCLRAVVFRERKTKIYDLLIEVQSRWNSDWDDAILATAIKEVKKITKSTNLNFKATIRHFDLSLQSLKKTS
jgi:hypothetical protein